MRKLKVFILVLALVGIGAGGVSAQSWYDSFAPGIDSSKVLLNIGVGVGASPYSMGIPPLSFSADFKLPVNLPITVGGIAAIST